MMLYLLLLLSGVTGLICEVVWTRWLTGLFGSASAATAIVLAVFMGGLAVGSWLSAGLADRVRRPIRLYAFAELGVALLVLVPSLVVPWMGGLFLSLARSWGPLSPALDVMRLVVALCTLGPPTILMGASLPLVVKAMAHTKNMVGRRTATAYAANSLGGVLGTLFAGFFLIEVFGVTGTAWTASGLAALVGALALLLDRSILRDDPSANATRTTRRVEDTQLARYASKHGDTCRKRRPIATTIAPRGEAYWILVAAAVTGFCALGYETIWTRVLSVLAMNTTYAFSLMLAVLLCGLSLGSWLIRGRLAQMRDPAGWFVTIQILLALYAVSSLLWAPSIVELANNLVPRGDETQFAPWFTRPLVMAACLLLVPSVFMGAALPVVCQLYASMTHGIGRPAGRVYAANTLGSVAGAALVGLLVIPSCGTRWAAVICAVLGTVTAMGTAWWYTSPHRRSLYATAGSVVTVMILALGTVLGDAFVTQQGLGTRAEVVFRVEDEYGLVEVSEDKRLGTRWMFTNRLHWEGSTVPSAVAEQRKQGLLPIVLHPSPRRVLEIGLGTGIKLSVLDSPVVREAVAVEISPGVVEASRRFAAYNHNIVSEGSKVRVVCADGRNYVSLTPRTFDVIVNGLLTPYRAGVSRLYTVEHFRNCREKLSPDGMFVVWVAIRQIAPDDLKVLTRTLLEVFPHTTMWLDGYYMAFVSTRQPLTLNADEIGRRCADDSLAPALDEAGIDSPFALLATFVAGPKTLAAFAGNRPLNTEDRPIIEFRTPRLADRLNTSELAAEMIGTLSLLQEPLFPDYATATESVQTRISRAQQARWIARQALTAKCYGNHVEAAKLFRDALAQDATDGLARYEMEMYLIAHGKQCVDRGLLDRAHRVFSEAISVNPSSVAALASLATLEETAGNRVGAERLWHRVLSLDPRNHHLRRHVAAQSRSESIGPY